MVSESKGLNPLVALKREQANSPHVTAGGDNQHNCHPPRGLSW